MRSHAPKLALLAACACAPAWAAPERYEIDPMHTYPSFEFPHMGISVWRGKFDRTRGRVTIDRAARTGTVEVTVDPASIDFGLDAMNQEARSDNFFNVAAFPEASYKGTIVFEGAAPKAVDGVVTVMGVSKPVRLAINLFNCIPHPMLKKEVCGADAEGEMNWSVFGMKMSKYGEGDAGRLHLRIQVEAIKQD